MGESIGNPNSPMSRSVEQGGCLIKERVIESQYMLLGNIDN